MVRVLRTHDHGPVYAERVGSVVHDGFDVVGTRPVAGGVGVRTFVEPLNVL